MFNAFCVCIVSIAKHSTPYTTPVFTVYERSICSWRVPLKKHCNTFYKKLIEKKTIEFKFYIVFDASVVNSAYVALRENEYKNIAQCTIMSITDHLLVVVVVPMKSHFMTEPSKGCQLL